MCSGNPEPIVGNRGAAILGPRNVPIERQNPDALIAPATDAGTVPNLKWPFALSHNRVLGGGFARETTTRELPISMEISGVEVIEGNCRISLFDEEGCVFIDDVSAGDLWYFPSGLPHSIQALKDGVEFLLAFDSGDFSENETFLICDWFAHTPREVLAKNFGVDKSAFDELPTDIGHTRYMFAGKVPPSLSEDAPLPPAKQSRQSYTWRMMAQEPTRAPGGSVRITDSPNFTVSKAIAAARIEVEPGAIQELHWHPNADEWQYYLSGQRRMTVFASDGKSRTFDYQAGDVGYVPRDMGHYVENTGEEPLVFLALSRSDHYANISLGQWMGVLPPELVKAHLNVDDKFIANLPKGEPLVR
jgi:oxalate decarboxylase